MTVSAPPRPPEQQPAREGRPLEREEIEALVEALIEEARQETRRRRRRNATVVTLVALVGVALFALLGRSAQSQTVSPEPSARINVAVQTGTSRLAFTSNAGGTSEIYVVNADGSAKRLVARRLTPNFFSSPAWSPDGQTIAVAGLFINADGSGRRNVEREWGLDGLPVWSPDGRKIAFMRSWGNDGDIYVMNADGSGLRRLTRNDGPGWAWIPTWSPNSRKIAYSRIVPPRKPLPQGKGWRSEVWVMNADGSGQRRLGRGVPGAWSPDGRRIAFSSLTHDTRRREIYVMNADGSGQRRLTHNAVPEGGVAWSPDGQKILFGRQRPGTLGKVSDVYVMNADGSGRRMLAERGHGARWSPDGAKISFASRRDGNFEVYVMNADGNGLVNVSQNPLADDDWPAWSPGQK